MKTLLKRLTAGAVITILASAFTSCSPVVYAPSRPRAAVYTPAPPPVQTIVVTPVVPAWAPPYSYITEVHYYYFPDYMVYYDVFGQTYCYYNGYSWLNVVMLPSIPMYYGFSPYNSYLVVLNRSVNQPWINHNYYEQQYPTGYYKDAYTPRTALGSNTVLRAFDENQKKPVFVDKRSNKEVAIKYDIKPSRTSFSNSSVNPNNSVASYTDKKMVQNSANSIQQNQETNFSSNGLIKNNAQLGVSHPIKNNSPSITKTKSAMPNYNMIKSNSDEKKSNISSVMKKPDSLKNTEGGIQQKQKNMFERSEKRKVR